LNLSNSDRALLYSGPWFSSLPAVLQGRIVADSELRTYRKGEFIIREGEPGTGMGTVLEGQVHLTRRVGRGTDTLVDVGHPGIWFGNYGTLTGGGASIGGLVAATAVRALFLPLAAFERIVDDEPRHYRLFAGILMQRFAQLFRHLGEAKGLAPEDRLRTRLLELANTRDDAAPGIGSVDVAVSQSELAKLVGLSRQTVSALLARLESRGLIEIGFRSIRVLV
jgi:CRP-like cAMP-binding protein